MLARLALVALSGLSAARGSYDPLEIVRRIGDPVPYAQEALETSSVQDRMDRACELVRCGQYALALDVGLPIIDAPRSRWLGPRDWDAATLADALVGLSRFDEADALLEHALARDGNRPELLLALGRAHRARGDEEGCLRAWRAAVAGGGRFEATRTLARALIDRGEHAAALEWLEPFERSGRPTGCFPRPPWSSRDELMIECWLALGRFEDAERTSRHFTFEIEGRFARTVPFAFACAWIDSQLELGRSWLGIVAEGESLTAGKQRDLSNLELAFDVVSATRARDASGLFEALTGSDRTSFPIVMKRLKSSAGATDVAQRELGGPHELLACAVLASLNDESVVPTLDARIRAVLSGGVEPTEAAAELHLLASMDSGAADLVLESLKTPGGRSQIDLVIGYLSHGVARYAGAPWASYVLR